MSTILATEPILTRIEHAMYDLIGGMRLGTYNFDWGTVNQPDLAKVTFPSALVVLEEEINMDEAGGAWSNGYLNQAIYIITVRAKLNEEKHIPIFEIDAELNKALDDLKKLFGSNYSVDGSCDRIMYRGMRRNLERTGDLFVPKSMETRWNVEYTQGRTTPTSFGE